TCALPIYVPRRTASTDGSNDSLNRGMNRSIRARRARRPSPAIPVEKGRSGGEAAGLGVGESAGGRRAGGAALAGIPDAELLDLAVQGGAADAEDLASAALVPAAGLQRLEDGLALGFRQREQARCFAHHRGRRGWRLGEGEVLLEEDFAGRHHGRADEGVFQLPDVSGPGELLEL